MAASVVDGNSLPASGVKKCEKLRKLLTGKNIQLTATGPGANVLYKACLRWVYHIADI